METPKEVLARKLGEVFDYLGIDHWYGMTAILFLLALTNLKDVRNWNSLRWYVKVNVAGTFIGFFFGLCICTYKLFGGTKF